MSTLKFHSDVTANKRMICLISRQVAREKFSVLDFT
jgi:hypothetical protein